EWLRLGLCFVAGELVIVLQVLDGSWWEGQENGLHGWFLASYLKQLEDAVSFPNSQFLGTQPRKLLGPPLPPGLGSRATEQPNLRCLAGRRRGASQGKQQKP
ncbi:unnamed protein product, partial [Natator depressus]